MIMLILVVVILCILNSSYGYHHSYVNMFINYQRQLNYRVNTLSAVKPVTVSFEPSGKSIISEQGALIADVAKKAGVTIPYGCRQGRCNSCEVRLNGRGKLTTTIRILAHSTSISFSTYDTIVMSCSRNIDID